MKIDSLKNRLVNWLKKQVQAAKAKGLVVGVSGGVDSAVVAALAKLACGKNVLGLILPCQSLAADMEYAHQAARALGIRTKTIQLDGAFTALRKLLPGAKNRMALGNIKPRLRMITLYYHAALNNYLVAGTGNKTELALGYFTKYGDGGVDLLPLGDLVKSQVRALAGELRVPRTIIDRVPTAGLYPGQTDEGEIGLKYDQLDALVLGRQVKGLKPCQREKVKRMMKSSQHKRSPIPVFYKRKTKQ